MSETIICAGIVDAARRNLAALLAAAVMGHLFSVVDDSDRIFRNAKSLLIQRAA